ncbi:MAG: Gfo/Idh/MocA family oxidoreductase [Spirochaetota bacterium]
MAPIRIGLVGVAGFGESHLKSIAYCEEKGVARLLAAVIRNPEKDAAREAELRARGVRIYRNYEKMYQDEMGKLDLIAIPCGIDQHEELSIRALTAGYHVMCEKPAAGTAAEVERMKAAADASGNILAIGYQNIYSPSIQAVKNAVLAKRFGRLIKAKTYVLWPRSSAYYKRNGWAGHIRFAGKAVHDSPMQNAVAHFLNNMLYVAGRTHDASANPVSVYMENYRIKEIESADTQFIRVITDAKVPVSFIASHACAEQFGPVTEFICEKGKMVWTGQSKADFYRANGKGYELVETIDNGKIPLHHLVFMNVCEAIEKGTKPLTTIANAMQQVICIDNGFRSSGGVVVVDMKYGKKLPIEKEAYNPNLDVSNEHNAVITGIEDTVKAMFDEDKGFFEMKLPWAKKSRTIVLAAKKAKPAPGKKPKGKKRRR